MVTKAYTPPKYTGKQLDKEVTSALILSILAAYLDITGLFTIPALFRCAMLRDECERVKKDTLVPKIGMAIALIGLVKPILLLLVLPFWF